MSSGRHYAARLYYKTQEASVFSKWLEAERQLEQGNEAEADRMIQDALDKTSDLTAECLRRELASRNYAAGTELARQVNALANPDVANDLKLHALPHELEDIVPRRRLLVRAAISSRRGSDPVESQQHAFAAAMQAALPSAPGMALCGYDAMLFLASNDTLQDYYSKMPNCVVIRFIGQEGDLAPTDKPLLSLKHKGIRGEARGVGPLSSMVYFGFLRYAEIVLSSAHDSVRHNIWHRPWDWQFFNGKRETIRAEKDATPTATRGCVWRWRAISCWSRWWPSPSRCISYRQDVQGSAEGSRHQSWTGTPTRRAAPSARGQRTHHGRYWRY